jgi:GMP synthase-like glutamine amidotransferase
MNEDQRSAPVVVPNPDDSSRKRIVLRKTVVVRAISQNRNLSLMMIACEQLPPYGGIVETASMFLHLFSTAIQEKHNRANICESDENCMSSIEITISIYNAQLLDYPTSAEEWDSYDGIIIPGSFNSAYDSLEWIEFLKQQVILKHIHPYQRKTLGVCFGHQIMAHAFYPDGLATPCTAGSQMGCKIMYNTSTTTISAAARQLLLPNNDNNSNSGCKKPNKGEYSLFYTHGDMVAKLPSCAIPLASTSNVNIVAAAFFGSTEDAILFQQSTIHHDKSALSRTTSTKLPNAITFQAHPEFFDSEGFHTHFKNCIRSMMFQQRSTLSDEEEASFEAVFKSAMTHKDLVWNNTMDLMIQVGTIFNWF